MRLISARVRNYRVHGDLEVAFDPARTLIGGPNESGKSTLIEAIHRAFFLRAKTTGDVLESMTSRRHAGAPEVEVRFRAADRVYTLHKVFDGARGVTRLTEDGGASLRNEEAEGVLSGLLDGAEAESGRGAAGRIGGRWGHLWVWQGESAQDPADRIGASSAALIRRLQSAGGAGALQSDLDARLAEEAASRYREWFTTGGKPRTGSPLKQAEENLAAARTKRDEAEAGLSETLRYAERFQTAEREITRLEENRRSVERDRQTLALRLKEIQALQAVEKDQDEALQRLRGSEKESSEADRTIRELGKKEETLRAELEPLTKERDELDARRKSLKARREELERETEADEKRLRNQRSLRELFQVCREIRQLEIELGEAGERLAEIVKVRESLSAVERELGELPAIARSDFDALRDLEERLSVGESRLESIAAGVEVRETGESVSVDGEPMHSGERRTFTRPADIRIGERTVLRLSPGGGRSLEEARREVDAVRENRDGVLRKHAVRSLDEARDIVSRREALLGRRENERTRLKALKPEVVERREAELKKEIAARRRRLTVLKEPFDEDPVPTESEALESASEAVEGELARLETDGRKRQAELKALRQQLDTCESELQKAEAARRKREAELLDTRTRLGYLEERHGEAEARARALAECREAIEKHQKARSETGERLRSLGADRVESDRERLERALKQCDDNLASAREARAVSESHLLTEGVRDPESEAELARENLRRAEEAFARENVRGEAIALLHRTFQEARSELADRFSRPLADRINGYLRALFGQGIEAGARFQDSRLAGFDVVRNEREGAYPFEVLSGGAREQVAAAARLAVAELLAEEVGGCLPVVFDDAFAYSDPERARDLPRMLDRAAERGLQVIVLTCNPGDYAALGAREIRLETPGGI